MVSRMITNICCDNLEAGKAFYTQLLGLNIGFESDWYIQFQSPTHPNLEYALIARDNELVPSDYQQAPTGMYVTFGVDNVDEIFEKAQSMSASIVQEPRDEFYGQRRMLLKDPSGCLLDISSLIP